MDWLFGIFLVGFIVISVSLVLIILVQRPQGGGLAAAFGGSSGGSTDTAFGGRTGDVLTVTTVGAFALYLALAIGLNIVSNLRVEESMRAGATTEQGTPAVDGTVTDQPATGPSDITLGDNTSAGPADSSAQQPKDVNLGDIPGGVSEAVAPSAAPSQEPAPAPAPAPSSEPAAAPAPGN